MLLQLPPPQLSPGQCSPPQEAWPLLSKVLGPWCCWSWQHPGWHWGVGCYQGKTYRQCQRHNIQCIRVTLLHACAHTHMYTHSLCLCGAKVLAAITGSPTTGVRAFVQCAVVVTRKRARVWSAGTWKRTNLALQQIWVWHPCFRGSDKCNSSCIGYHKKQHVCVLFLVWLWLIEANTFINLINRICDFNRRFKCFEEIVKIKTIN